MEGRLGNGQAGVGGLVMGTGLKTAIWLAGLAISIASVLVPASASAQSFGEQPARYGNTANFFNYDSRDDHRDFLTNGVFPGNFAADPLKASIGAAGWLGINPRHSPQPYPSQTYVVDVRGRVFCQQYRVDDTSTLTPRQRYHACLPR